MFRKKKSEAVAPCINHTWTEGEDTFRVADMTEDQILRILGAATEVCSKCGATRYVTDWIDFTDNEQFSSKEIKTKYWQ